MADTHRIVRSLFTISIDLTGSATYVHANQIPIGLAQSYNLDTVVNVQNLVANDLADPTGAAAWANPEPTDKSWSVTIDNLFLVADAVNPDYDVTGKETPDAILEGLKAGTVVWVSGNDSDLASGGIVPWYGQGIITGYNQAGTIDEFHTYSCTIMGQGEIQTALTLT